ncbi:MAG: LPS-assembly protein LptD [Methylotenera sp.]|nr:LPS-assembly protein LptD [Methylotenera sp.]
MLKARFLSGMTTILLACGLSAHADDETIVANKSPSEPSDTLVIDGDKLELHLDRKMRAIGNASISRGKQKVLGDVIDYDIQNDELHVIGNAQINLGNSQLSGTELRMQMSESIGEIKDASIRMIDNAVPNSTRGKTLPNIRSSETFSKSLGNLQSQQIGGAADYTDTNSTVDGNRIQKNSVDGASNSLLQHSSQARGDAKMIFFEGQDRKRLKDARFTTCAADVNDWYIKAGELELDNYTNTGAAKNAYIEFKGVPLIYSPWMSFSFNNQRKSGLLAPTYGTTSRSGFELTTPFYWNMSPNMDATLATRVLSKRGVQLQGEFRYLEDKFSGINNLEYLPNDNQNNQDRFYANLKHQHNLGKGWSAGYSLEKVSDDEYFADLSTRIVTTSRINLPQQFNIDYADETWRFNALAQKFQTLDNLSFPYERLPQMTLSGNKYFGDVNTNLYTQLVAFDTNKNAPSIATGSRFTLYPSISYPLYRSFGYMTPKVGVHHTTYSLNNNVNNQNSFDRTLPIASLDGGLFFDRDFKISDRAYSQTIEPRLFYVYIPDAEQSTIPVFDTSESDLNFSTLFNENQFAGNDRINNANQLSLSLTTRLIESDSGIQRLSASIGQRYYFTDQKVALPGAPLRTGNSSDIIAGLSTNLKTRWNVDAFWQYNTDDASAVRTTVTSRYRPEPGKTLNLSYSYRRDLTGNVINAGINQFDISGQWPLGQGWYGIGRVNYSLREGQLVETLAGLEYDAGCWQTRTVMQRVSTATAEANYALFFQLELGGLASIGANPLTVIQRNIPGYVSTGLIPDTYQQPYYE